MDREESTSVQLGDRKIEHVWRKLLRASILPWVPLGEFLGSFDQCWIRRLHLSFLDIHNDLCYFLGLLEMDISPIKWNTPQSRNFRWLNKGQNIQVSHALSYLIVATTLWKSLFGLFFLIWGIRAQRTEVFASSLIFGKLHREDWMFAGFQNPFSFHCTMWLWPVGEEGEEWRKIGRRWIQTRLREKIP